jgi:hypothetical protein
MAGSRPGLHELGLNAEPVTTQAVGQNYSLLRQLGNWDITNTGEGYEACVLRIDRAVPYSLAENAEQRERAIVLPLTSRDGTGVGTRAGNVGGWDLDSGVPE